jgi:hypothetical protein
MTQIGEFRETTDCKMLLTEGIAHNIKFEKVKFVGEN